MRRLIVLTAVALALMGCALEAPAERVGQAEGTPDERVASAQPETFVIGDVVRRRSLEAAVLQANDNYVSANEFERPEEGKKIVAVEFRLRNTGSVSEQLSTILQFKLRDASDASYDVSFFGPEPRFPDGEITAGDTVRGWVAFEVAEGAGGFRFVFDAEVFGGGRLTWVL